VINGSSQIPILTGGVGNATITPSSSGVLAFTDDGKITQSAGAILIGGAALLADDASYEVTQNLSLTLNAGGSLTLDGPDAALILDNDGSDAAALKGTGELIAGGAKIVGGTNGWTADNANSSPLTVIISPDSIRGSTADAILAGADSSSAITVAAAGNLALVENIKIDLSTAGTITITQTGLITLGPDSSIIGVGTSVGTGNSTSITNIISGANIVYTSNAGDVLETITTTDGTTGNTLTADGGNATIDKTTTVS
jgi:hypothetical protein